MQIRKAKIADAKCMAKLHIDVWQAAYKGIMPDVLLDNMDLHSYEQGWFNTLKSPGKGRYLVALLGEEIIGFATFGPARNKIIEATNPAELVAINVSPDYWREGIGSKLLLSIIDNVKLSYESLYLWVAEKNTRAVSFYENFGFIHDGKTKTDQSHGDIVELLYVAKLSVLSDILVAKSRLLSKVE